jgi:hypothetical protein
VMWYANRIENAIILDAYSVALPLHNVLAIMSDTCAGPTYSARCLGSTSCPKLEQKVNGFD